MTTPNEEDERAADAFIVSLSRTTIGGTPGSLLRRGFKYGHATARGKLEGDMEPLTQRLADAKARADDAVVQRDKAEALFAEERRNANRLAAALDWTPIPEGTPMDYSWQKERHEALTAHRKRREAIPEARAHLEEHNGLHSEDPSLPACISCGARTRLAYDGVCPACWEE